MEGGFPRLMCSKEAPSSKSSQDGGNVVCNHRPSSQAGVNLMRMCSKEAPSSKSSQDGGNVVRNHRPSSQAGVNLMRKCSKEAPSSGTQQGIRPGAPLRVRRDHHGPGRRIPAPGLGLRRGVCAERTFVHRPVRPAFGRVCSVAQRRVYPKCGHSTKRCNFPMPKSVKRCGMRQLCWSNHHGHILFVLYYCNSR